MASLPSDHRTLNFDQIVNRLGCSRMTVARQVVYLQKLVDHAGFPRPFPTLRRDVLILSVAPRSIWPAAAVEQWFGDRQPPDAAAVRPATRATRLRLIQGGRA